MHSPLRLLLIGATPSLASFAGRHCGPESSAFADLAATLAEAEAMLCSDLAYDAIVLDAAGVVVAAGEVEAIAARAALVAVVVEPDAEHTLGWLRSGAEDVLGPDELLGPAGWRRLRFAVERRRRGEGREPAYATDPGTGLPHRRQVVEHLSQLLALRERDPSPMAVLALRVELPSAPGGGEDAELLRRKIAVRLRAGVRASDIVAAIDGEDFAVVLGMLLVPGDAARVAEKLVAAVARPIRVGTREHSVPVAFGIAHYPQDGNQAERLLRRALALAAVAPALTQAGPAALQDAAGGVRVAANDEA
ncbi:MAG: diguanylate cyclase [Burkholderiales bacterium]|nr:diguanylate cyclase [Burkholderiales bacterium]